jgi:hypothetical protein
MYEKLMICKGLVYRYKENNFINKKGEIVFQKRFIPVKRLSCTGCPICDCKKDWLKEDFTLQIYPELPNFNNGALVFLSSRGYEDDCELIFEVYTVNEESSDTE